MATDNLQALFGGTMLPQDMQQELINQRAQQFAQLTPSQQLGQMGYKTGAAIGGGLAQAMGVDITDPRIKRQSQLQALSQGVESTPEGLKAFAKKLQAGGFAAEAAMAMDKAREASLTEAKTTSLVEDKQAAREQQLMLAREKIQAQIDIARERGATQLQIAQMMQDGRMQMAQLAAAMKGSQPKNLPPSLQKDEGKDLEVIDTYTGQAAALKPALDALTPDAKGMRKLELGPLKNIKYEAQLAAGNSSPEARAYEGLKSAVDTAVNLQVSAEKGVQTDKDVLRFAKALVASYGRNDTEATLQALQRYQESLVKAQDRAKGRVESRRRSQGVDPYYVGETTSTGNSNSDPLGIRK